MRLVLPLLLAACGGSPEPADVPAKAPVPAAPTGEATPHTHGDHGHGAKHGGIQAELEGMHVEALAMADGVMFWVTDADAKPMSPAGFTGTATVKGPSGVATVDLMGMEDHLHAPAKLVQGQPAVIVLTLSKDGKAQSATFDVPAVGLEAHAHTSLHGGQVGMWGDFHVEYVGRDGAYRFWVSDANRETVTLPLAGSVKDGDRTVVLTADAATGMLSGKGDGAGTRPVMVDVKAGDTSFSLAFNPTEGAGAAH